MTRYKVGYFVGSLATKSINRLLARALVKLTPPQLELKELSFRDLPLYSYDYDANYPKVATELKNAIAAVDAVLFVTPELQPLNSGRVKECDRLGEQTLWPERVHAKAIGGHRYVSRKDWNCYSPAASPQHSRVLQLAADEFNRSVHSVRARSRS